MYIQHRYTNNHTQTVQYTVQFVVSFDSHDVMHFVACDCDIGGSVLQSCGDDGICSCHPNVTGTQCNACEPEHYGLATSMLGLVIIIMYSLIFYRYESICILY